VFGSSFFHLFPSLFFSEQDGFSFAFFFFQGDEELLENHI
jgi:hypothetical protein